MPHTIVMREDSPTNEYHGKFDAIPGDAVELPLSEAMEIVEKFPMIFEPVSFDLEKEKNKIRTAKEAKRTSTAEVGVKLLHNPIFQSYHSVDVSFEKVGDIRYISYERAKELFTKFQGAFDLIAETPFQEEAKPEVVEIKTPTSPELAALMEQRILTVVKTSPLSLTEIKKQLPDEEEQFITSCLELLEARGAIIKDKNKWVLKTI